MQNQDEDGSRSLPAATSALFKTRSGMLPGLGPTFGDGQRNSVGEGAGGLYSNDSDEQSIASEDIDVISTGGGVDESDGDMSF